MKRFYKLVSVDAVRNGFEIQLDGRNIKTPMKNILSAPSRKLADAIMAEWAAQDKEILPDTMPLTQILSTRIDRVSNERHLVCEKIWWRPSRYNWARGIKAATKFA